MVIWAEIAHSFKPLMSLTLSLLDGCFCLLLCFWKFDWTWADVLYCNHKGLSFVSFPFLYFFSLELSLNYIVSVY